MLVSAEIRLFWFDTKPSELEAWFMDAAIHGTKAGGPEDRTDIYLCDEKQAELGVKTRGRNPGVEVKGLIEKSVGELEFDSYLIPIELWSKWPSEPLRVDAQAGVTLHKQRWIRTFDTTQTPPAASPWAMPEIGCNVEWTVVMTASGEMCWTLGFEAFGHLQDVESSLRSTVGMMNDRRPPHSPGALALSYPALIQKVACTRIIDQTNVRGLT